MTDSIADLVADAVGGVVSDPRRQAHHGLDAALDRAEAAAVDVRERMPAAAPHPADRLDGPEAGWQTVPVATSWRPVDLEGVLAGDLARPEATVLCRRDGPGLLYRGRVNLLYGRPESGKSWVAMLAVVEAIQAGGRAVIIDLESDPAEVLPRLLALGLSREAIATGLTYLRPSDPLHAITRGASAQADRDLAVALEQAPDVIVVDAVGELFAVHALDPLSNRDAPPVTGWLRRLAESTGAAVIALDHTPHAPREGGASAPIGAQHKLAATTGVALEVKATRPLAPGRTGEIALVIAKDRPGSVRAASSGKIAARVTLDAQTHDGQILASIEPDSRRPGERTPALLARMTEVRTVLAAAGETGLSKRSLRTEVRGNNDLTDDALAALIDDGEVDRRPGPRGALQHVLTDPNNQPDDPQQGGPDVAL